MSVYLDLTREFNRRGLRAILSSDQAVVLHRLAVLSKDGDWILREDREELDRVLAVLAEHGARYRFGAPLDVRWMRGGWSAHVEFHAAGLRVRTDFVTRPPRLSPEDLAGLWREQERAPIPFVDARRLVELKKTDREKDYAVIGELARLLADPEEQLLASRSAEDLRSLAAAHPEAARRAARSRPLVALSAGDPAALEAALDAERRALVRENRRRLQSYLDAAEAWAEAWLAVEREISGLPLGEAHRIVVARAERILPFAP